MSLSSKTLKITKKCFSSYIVLFVSSARSGEKTDVNKNQHEHETVWKTENSKHVSHWLYRFLNAYLIVLWRSSSCTGHMLHLVLVEFSVGEKLCTLRNAAHPKIKVLRCSATQLWWLHTVCVFGCSFISSKCPRQRSFIFCDAISNCWTGESKKIRPKNIMKKNSKSSLERVRWCFPPRVHHGGVKRTKEGKKKARVFKKQLSQR